MLSLVCQSTMLSYGFVMVPIQCLFVIQSLLVSWIFTILRNPSHKEWIENFEGNNNNNDCTNHNKINKVRDVKRN
ncbi:unnamed protein product [Strongylus vulgaris]|uniref:Uncharacterized protein n=1 Tax=Strongylus vulgaris TaxID=40348 RepID=A0A3P7L2I1_STRVU|nr:unnamed protein product [Strongylus vulgaris]